MYKIDIKILTKSIISTSSIGNSPSPTAKELEDLKRPFVPFSSWRSRHVTQLQVAEEAKEVVEGHVEFAVRFGVEAQLVFDGRVDSVPVTVSAWFD